MPDSTQRLDEIERRLGVLEKAARKETTQRRWRAIATLLLLVAVGTFVIVQFSKLGL